MVKVYDTSGALKSLLSELHKQDINQFDSLESILEFQSNFEKKIDEYITVKREELRNETMIYNYKGTVVNISGEKYEQNRFRH